NDEFIEFLRQSRYNNRVDPNIFSSLDSNNYNGFLDFIEVITLFYIIRTRHLATPMISVLNAIANGGTYNHDHVSFLDSYVWLQSKRGLRPGKPNLNQVRKY
ncbi:hypothetical protein CFP56_012442, partial [Quercus suber]